MLVLNNPIVLCAFMILNVNSAFGKTLRNAEVKQGGRDLMFGADAASANAELENQWENFAVEQQMSIPTTMAPAVPSAPPTAAPTPTPPPTTEAETAPPTASATPNPTATPPPTIVLTPEPTPEPTPNPTTLPPTGPVSLFLDEDDVFDEFSLVECQGDCDDDSDCEFGLICFQRDIETVDVPGCLGDAATVGDGFDDFCIKPQTDDTLVIVGDEGIPASSFPLGKCQGDCDIDDDCAEGLSCFDRVGDEIVPGCIGAGGSTWDYCFDPSATDKELNFVGLPDPVWEYFELNQCEGDCDFDSDCGIGLVCWQRDAGDDGVVPSCTGDANTIETGAEDYCIIRPSPTYLSSVYDHFEVANEGTLPIGLCSGDCDFDSECEGDLICYYRKAFDPVPGCEGLGEDNFDYCVPPDTPDKALDFVGDEENGYYELKECEGDCDFDSDCDLGLACFQRDAGDDGIIPGCAGNANDLGTGSEDFCIKRPSDTYLISAFDDIDFAEDGLYPLPNCAGDCDTDVDCATGLTCFTRLGTGGVPGCEGEGEEDFDYCIIP
ncbi:MAG: hypothetical protein SGBAC_008824 [Bacillariaceae sp.]